ncbi:ATP synthase F1 subunit gamma [Candidatus Daviesbacteria bacterium]|nr:ATP synthase F1 subunit gamma [Candidatus Daviesbacteria bacterium]
MANTRELRRRIKSVKNTAQITKAMQMVAAAKMRKAQNQATSGRPYLETLSDAIAHLYGKIDIKTHTLLSGNDSKTEAIMVLSTDKGLVGALNTNIIRQLASHIGSGNVVVYYTVGRKGRSFVARTGGDLKADFENLDTITFRQAKQLSKLIMDAFKTGEIGEAFMVYPHFLSTLRQEARRVKLLPIDVGSLVSSSNNELTGPEFLFEPDVDVLLDFLLVHHIEEQIYQALLETKASEHSSRMMAMQNATDNALELVDDLKLTYNQTRQSAITNELLEITTAQAAMN